MAAVRRVKNVLLKASRTAARDAVSRMQRNLRHGKWIAKSNVYAKYFQRNSASYNSRFTQLNQTQILDYIAASIFTHCSDGWRFLGKAISLQSRGDNNTSVHLAYYAELRAAMSLLAAEGVGVFNHTHIILRDGPLRAQVLTHAGGTHKFVWDALEYWSSRRLSAQILAKVVTPGGIELADWFHTFGIGNYTHIVGRSWLRSWGIDIKRYSEDRNLRNHASYRPSRIVAKNSTNADKSIDFIKRLWKLSEPTPASRFEEIDRHLLRESLCLVYSSSIPPFANPRLPGNTAAYEAWIKSNIQNFNFSQSIENQWVKFLTWKIEPDKPLILDSAANKGYVESENYHHHVIARAFLLLRIATGINGSLLNELSINMQDLDFWWESEIEDNGLLHSHAEIDNFLDLWSDIDIALQDVESWEQGQQLPYSYSQLVTNLSQPISRLSECERISLWGLGI